MVGPGVGLGDQVMRGMGITERDELGRKDIAEERQSNYMYGIKIQKRSSTSSLPLEVTATGQLEDE